jgi:hypothetical protein
MILKIKIIKTIFNNLWIVTCIVNAQQNPHYTEYMYNTMVVNPAMLAQQEAQKRHLGRSQWVGIDISTNTIVLSSCSIEE